MWGSSYHGGPATLWLGLVSGQQFGQPAGHPARKPAAFLRASVAACCGRAQENVQPCARGFPSSSRNKRQPEMKEGQPNWVKL